MKRSASSGGLDGWLLIFGGLWIGMVLWLAPIAGASSRNDDARAKQDFDGLVHTIAAQYHMHANTVPMMWVANLCANRLTHGGVRGMKVVEFEDADGIAKADGKAGAFGELVKTQLGERWSPIVRNRDAHGGDSYVYVQAADGGTLTRMIAIDLDGAELNVVSLTLNPDQLAKWVKDHNSSRDSDGGD